MSYLKRAAVFPVLSTRISEISFASVAGMVENVQIGWIYSKLAAQSIKLLYKAAVQIYG